jgi:hypothetical protein
LLSHVYCSTYTNSDILDNLFKDEVLTTKNSYQIQLDMMSDHLCGMSEKLTSQKDEIDALKTGKSKKGKNWFQSLKDKGSSEDNME